MPSTKFILLTCLISLCGSKSTAKVPYSRNEDSSVKHEESLQMSKLFNFFFKSKISVNNPFAMPTEVVPKEDSRFSEVKSVGSCKCCPSTLYQEGKNIYDYSIKT